MKRLFVSLIVLSALGSSQAVSQIGNDRIPVTLRLVGDDALSQKLYSELEATLRKDDRVRIGGDSGTRAIVIQTDGNVEWDTLDGRQVAIVIAFVFAEGEDRHDPVVAACWTNDVRKCALEVVRVVRIQALNMRMEKRRTN